MIGALVGISMSFIGQTGQGVVVPLILLITGDVLLAIAINVVNDIIAAIPVAINYVRKKEFQVYKNVAILMVISVLTALLGVFILMTTQLKIIFGWVIPLFIIFLGSTILNKGFPTAESLNKLVQKIKLKFKKNRQDSTNSIVDEFKTTIKPYSKLFFILAIVLGVYVGFNCGLFGASSGFIITLALIIIYGYPLKKGVGTAIVLSMIMCIFTFSMFQVLGYQYTGQFYYDWMITLYLGIGTFTSAIIFSNYVQRLSAKAMGRGIGAIMIFIGLISLIFYFIP
jgi:uncharacterized membrane protein YfcA